jgi:hypothetical protein
MLLKLPAALIGLSLCITIGCGFWEDSWAHYTAGGLFQTESPDWSPDEAEIVFASPASGHGDLYLCELASQQRRRLTDSPLYESNPRFAGSKDRILFTQEQEGCRHVMLFDVTRDTQTQVTDGRFVDDLVDVSLDGRCLLIRRSPLPTGGGRIVSDYLIEQTAAGDWKPPLSLGPIASMSANAELIAYQHPERLDEIWLWDRAADARERVANGTLLRLSPSGKYLVTADSRANGADDSLRLIDVESGRAVQLPNGHSVVPLPGELGVLMRQGYASDLLWVDLEGQVKRTFQLPKGYFTSPRPAKEGQKCVLSALPSGNDRSDRHYVLDLGSGELNATCCSQETKAAVDSEE